MMYTMLMIGYLVIIVILIVFIVKLSKATFKNDDHVDHRTQDNG